MMPDGGLGFAGKMVEQWLKRMPKQTNSKLLMQHFNHSMQAYFDSVYELTLLPFYISASHDSPFWQRISTLKQTDKIQHFIRLFRETGVFPTYEHYPQELDYYENMLVCLGCQPSAFDPLVYGMLSSSTLTRLEQLQNQLINTAKGLPQSH